MARKRKNEEPQNFLDLSPDTEKLYHVSPLYCGKKTVITRADGTLYCTTCKLEIHPAYKEAVSKYPRSSK